MSPPSLVLAATGAGAADVGAGVALAGAARAELGAAAVVAAAGPEAVSVNATDPVTGCPSSETTRYPIS
jgi:hypothetical protein